MSICARADLGEALTEREMDVLLGYADGLQSADLSRELHLSQNTIASHRKNVLEKLGARTITHAVALAYHRGLLTPLPTR